MQFLQYILIDCLWYLDTMEGVYIMLWSHMNKPLGNITKARLQLIMCQQVFN